MSSDQKTTTWGVGGQPLGFRVCAFFAGAALGLSLLIGGCQNPEAGQDQTVPKQSQDKPLVGTYQAWAYASGAGWIQVPGVRLSIQAGALAYGSTIIFPVQHVGSQELGFRDGQIWFVASKSEKLVKTFLYDYYLQDASSFGVPILWLRGEFTSTKTLSGAPDPLTAGEQQTIAFVALGSTPSEPATELTVAASFQVELGGTGGQVPVATIPVSATGGLTYESSAPTIATVSNTGWVTAVSTGSCTINVRSFTGLTGSCAVTVQTPLTVSIIGGSLYSAGFSGDGGPATSAQFSYTAATAVDGDGNLLVCDTENARIRKIDLQSGTITTFAGDGTGSFTSGTTKDKSVGGQPRDICVDTVGNVWLISNAGLVRVEAVTGIMTNYTKGSYRRATPASDGGVFASTGFGGQIWKVSSVGNEVLFAGASQGTSSPDGTQALSATLYMPTKLVQVGNLLWFLDSSDSTRGGKIRTIDLTSLELGTALNLDSHYFGSFAADRKGGVYIGSEPGYLQHWDHVTKTVSRVFVQNAPGNTSSSTMFGMSCGSDGTLYFADGPSNVVMAVR